MVEVIFAADLWGFYSGEWKDSSHKARSKIIT